MAAKPIPDRFVTIQLDVKFGVLSGVAARRRTVRWVDADLCTWCGSLVADRVRHAVACTVKKDPYG